MPEGGFILRWKNSAPSRERLGYPETMRRLDRRLARCHRSDRQRAGLGVGPTAFDWLVEIIEVHSAGSEEQNDGLKSVHD